MDQSVPKPVVVQLDRDDAQPLLSAGLITLTLPTVDRAERQATLSLVCQLSRALRGDGPAATLDLSLELD